MTDQGFDDIGEAYCALTDAETDADEEEVVEDMAGLLREEDADTVEEAITMATNTTDLSEEEIREMFTQGAADVDDVGEIVKIWHADDSMTYRFVDIEIMGEATTFEIPNDSFNWRTFQQKIRANLNRQLREPDDWDAYVDTLLMESEIVERQADPIQKEHEALSNFKMDLNTKSVTDEKEHLAIRPRRTIYYDEDSGEAWVHTNAVQKSLTNTMGEVDRAAFQNLASEFMVGDGRTVRRRIDGTRHSVWRFDAESLEEWGVSLDIAEVEDLPGENGDI